MCKTTTLHVQHAFFVHFLAVVARLRHKTSVLQSWWTQHKKVSFSFSTLRYGPFRLNPETFANIWKIKWKWSMKLKQCEFFCRHPKILLPWQRDATTSLYCVNILRNVMPQYTTKQDFLRYTDIFTPHFIDDRVSSGYLLFNARVWIHENQGPWFGENYIIAKKPGRDQLHALPQSSPKIKPHAHH